MRYIVLVPILFLIVNFVFLEFIYSNDNKEEFIKEIQQKMGLMQVQLDSKEKEKNQISRKLTQSIEEQEEINKKYADQSKEFEDKENNYRKEIEKLTNQIKIQLEPNQKGASKKDSPAQLNVIEQADLEDEEYDYSNIKENRITVHLIPHSHLDPGWLLTMENYYQEKVKNILDTLIPALEKNKSRKFGWAEICYLERWWRDAKIEQRNKFRKLHERGQIEFLMGGKKKKKNFR